MWVEGGGAGLGIRSRREWGPAQVGNGFDHWYQKCGTRWSGCFCRKFHGQQVSWSFGNDVLLGGQGLAVRNSQREVEGSVYTFCP